MAATSKNRIVRSIAPKSLFEEASAVVGSSTTFNQGDLLYFDTSTHTLKRLTSEANAATFCGIARIGITNGVPNSPYQGLASQPSEARGALPGPQYGIIVALVLKSGNALNPGDSVYADPVDSNFGVQTNGTKIIGIYQGTPALGSVTGDGVSTVEVLLGARYPADTLLF